MNINLKVKGSTVRAEIDQVWPSGLCSSRFTPQVYAAVQGVILTAFDFKPISIMADVHQVLDEPRKIKTPPIRHAKDQMKRQKAALELIKKRMGRPNKLRKMGLSANQLQYVKTLLRSEQGCNNLFKIRKRGRKPVISNGHIVAVKTLVATFKYKRFTCREIKKCLEQFHPHLKSISTASVNAILKNHLHYRYRRVGLRDPVVTTRAHEEGRRDFARLLLGFHTLGY